MFVVMSEINAKKQLIEVFIIAADRRILAVWTPVLSKECADAYGLAVGG